MKKETIAIIGLGYWGSIVTNTLVTLKIFKKIYICDSDHKKVQIIKKKFKNKVQKVSINQILNNEFIKNIFLATPPKNNFRILKLLLKKNKNILIEKPGLIKMSHYKIIKKKLKKNNNKLSFGYIYIYNNYIRYLKKIIKSKKLGEIKYINLQRQNFGPIRNKVSAAFDLATHDISILQYIFEKKILLRKSINHDLLKKNNYDISFLNLSINKIKVDINVSWLNPEKIRKIIIIGSKKMLLYDEMNVKNPIQIYNNYVSFPKIDKFTKNYFNHSKYIFKGSSTGIKLSDKRPLNEEIKEFIKKNNTITDIDFSQKVIQTISKK
tara:strand:- start:355 stop:1323 length:969 start_codon:yes stop_codon:yes gene_type:complete